MLGAARWPALARVLLYRYAQLWSSVAWTFLLVGDESPVPEFGDRVRRGAGGVGGWTILLDIFIIP